MSSTTIPKMNTSSKSEPRGDYLRILLAREVLHYQGWYRVFAIVWLIGLWIVPVFEHPMWLLWIGLLMVLFLTPGQAGVDVLENTEEFIFSRPPTRADIFLSRMLPTALFLLSTGLIGILAIGYDLPQRVWSLLFSGGLTRPFASVRDGYWYPLAVLIPLLAHAIAGGIAALARSRQQVLVAGIVGIGGSWAIAGLGLGLENLLAGRPHGWLATPILALACIGWSVFCYGKYRVKEARSIGGETRPAGRIWHMSLWWVLWVFLFIVILGWLTMPSRRLDSSVSPMQEIPLNSQPLEPGSR